MKKMNVFMWLGILALASFAAGFAWADNKPSNWVAEQQISGTGPVTAWMDKGKCEAQGLGKCYDITDCNPAECAVKDVQEDDTSKPIWEAKTGAVVCDSRKDCHEKIKPVCDAEGVCVNFCPADKVPFIAKDYTEAYCTKLLGFQKKTVKKLMADAAKKAARDQAKTDAQAEVTKKDKALKDLKKALKDWDTLDQAGKDKALKDVLIHLVR